MTVTGVGATQTALGGMLAARGQVDRQAAAVAKGEYGAETVVGLKSSQTQFAANVKVLKVADGLTKQLLDELA